jgi:glyoxalase family protein
MRSLAEAAMQLLGIHHLTAISAQIRDNKRFYTDTLGMRLVKRSVNQDDVSAYHLFYADAIGSPGSDLTFFDWPVPPERRGGNAITRTSLRVSGADSLSYWRERFAGAGVHHGETRELDGRQTLEFEDPEGQRLSLVDDGGTGEAHPWSGSPVPRERQIRGLGPIELTVPALAPTDRVLQSVMNLRPVRTYPHAEDPGDTVHVYEMGEGGPAAELHVAERPRLPRAQQGAGGVHHVAFRTPDDEYDPWADRLNQLGVPNSGKVDRYWFRSLYFREPNGILFEIASDGPGFGVDEDMATLGEKLVLAPFLEPHRERIAAGLKPLD